MEKQRKIRVLVVDDSPVSREMIARGIPADPLIEVAATAKDPFEARDKILEVHPDVITCDVEMPQMNGVEFIRQLLPQYYIPVIVVSAVSDAVFTALEAGAVDFVVKPGTHAPQDMDRFIQDLTQKIKAASRAKAPLFKPERAPGGKAGNSGRGSDLIAIGASTGGTEAIYSILHALTPEVPGIVIVQHIPPLFSRMFAERLDAQTPLRVKEARSGDYVEPGKALIAPGDRHVKIKKIGGRYQVECFEGNKVNGHCPSVDVLFESVAQETGSRAIGIILTGMGYDGAKGLLSMRRKGCRTIGQDEASAVVYGMPKVAYDIGAVEIQTSIENIPRKIFELLG
ncbi:MAG: chemotaxis response regulator protein-glutamate methylesterase [Clostridia bacterium]|nr:chemotaxis response regulator protein-glutamate methylesterase [Clostridia bacterium]